MDNKLPLQTVSLAKKKADNYKLMKQTANYYLSIASFDNKGYAKLYALANGSYFNPSDYKHITNPQGLKEGHPLLRKGQPATVRNWPIIRPIVNQLWGEYLKRPDISLVRSINGDAPAAERDALVDKIAKAAHQDFVNNVAPAIDPSIPTAPTPNYEEIEQKHKQSYTDRRAELGQDAIDIVNEECNTYNTYKWNFYDFICTLFPVTYKAVKDNIIIHERVNTLDFWSYSTVDSYYLEDDIAQVRRCRVSNAQEIVDKFEDKIKAKDKAVILCGKEIAAGHNFNSNDDLMDFRTAVTAESNLTPSTEYYHIVFKSKKKKGILTYFDEIGREQKMPVDEDYKIDKDAGESVVWSWVDEYWETYKLADDVFTTPQPLEVQRNDFNGAAKSCYNGLSPWIINAKPMSPVAVLEPFQKKVNEYHYRVDHMAATNMGNVLLMDVSNIPNGATKGTDSFMYFAREHKFAFVNSKQAGANQAFNQYSVMQADNTQWVYKMYELIQAWTDLAREAIGMSPQRMAQVAPSERAGNVKAAIGQSNTNTEALFNTFDDFKDNDRQGLLDISKFAWRNGKARTFKSHDGRDKFFEATEDFQEGMYNVFHTDSGEELQKLTVFKELLQPMIQNSGPNGVDPSLIVKLLNSKSLAKIERLAQEEKELRDKINQQQAAAQNQSNEAIQQAQAQDKQLDRDAEKYKVDEINKVKLMEIQARLLVDGDDPATPGIDPIALEKNGLDREKLYQDISLQREKIASENRKAAQTAQIAREKMTNDLEIAKYRDKGKRGVK